MTEEEQRDAEESLSAPLLEDLRMEQQETPIRSPTMETLNRLEGMFALSCYIYDTSGAKFVQDIFPGRHLDYVREYVDLWSKSPSLAIGKLDFGNTQKLFALAWERHGHAAEEYFRVNMEFEASRG